MTLFTKLSDIITSLANNNQIMVKAGVGSEVVLDAFDGTIRELYEAQADELGFSVDNINFVKANNVRVSLDTPVKAGTVYKAFYHDGTKS